ncbi:rhodanese-like domain-containing protein [Pannus brasiliensis CCIBt3594]|uniref:Rhodanese-like domain-containing protein n=1 Tax=Pannus brasiliensis CCIBt3594 TaxID=1427578 RepID=A0AAW9R0G0_9CHRO
MNTVTNELAIVNPTTLQQLLENRSVTLVDAREPSEYREEHIEGAILVPLSTLDRQPPSIELARKLVLYCRSGNRSAQAARKLHALGYRDLSHLEGGITAWKKAGYSTKTDKNAPISIMRQVQIVAGSLVLTGTLLGAFVSPRFLLLSGFVGAGLLFAGISNTCALGILLAKLPYNRR